MLVNTPADTLKDKGEPKSSKIILEAIAQAEKTFQPYYGFCRFVDNQYSLRGNLSEAALSIGFTDQEYDLFWASIEILKPAIYAKPPRPIASPRFKDGKSVDKTVAELMERVLNSEFERSDIDQVMLDVRDDLALANRGVAWVTYESDRDGGGKRVCIEHLDRLDFLHEPARKWSEVGWVARRAWMTTSQIKERFGVDNSIAAAYIVRRDDRDNGAADDSERAGVWEVWHRRDNRVYWVGE